MVIEDRIGLANIALFARKKQIVNEYAMSFPCGKELLAIQAS